MSNSGYDLNILSSTQMAAGAKSVGEENRDHDTFCLTGFASLSDSICVDSDRASALFKRFDKLATRDLLYYQSELAELEARLDQFDKEDAEAVLSHPESCLTIRQNSRDWKSFESAARMGKKDIRWQQRMKLIKKIRRTLKAYREALLLDAQLFALGQPGNGSMAALSQIYRPKREVNKQKVLFPEDIVLQGASCELYPDPKDNNRPQDNDYVAITREGQSDSLTSFLRNHWPRFLHRNDWSKMPARHGLLSSISPRVRFYHSESVDTAGKIFSTFLAVVILLGSIFSLYYTSAEHPKLTLGLVAVFTLLFTTVLTQVTNASRSEVFGATAGYAAILVVFVSGNLGQQSS